MLRRYERKQVFPEISFKCVTTLDLNKCLKQIKYPRSLHTGAPISELPLKYHGLNSKDSVVCSETKLATQWFDTTNSMY